MSNKRAGDAPSGRVAVVGGGIMGNGIAQLAAMAGDAAVLHDIDEAALQRARIAIQTSLARFVKRGTLKAWDAGDALGRITFATELPAAVDGADVVIEAVSESLELKREVWTEIATHAPPSALLGTNTSQLSITSIASVLNTDARRLVGIHFFNPPVMMRLVELIAGTLTADTEVERARAFAVRLGKEVVVCRKDSPGFITSRAYAILRLECIRMLEEGIATAEDIDTALKLGFNFPMGPLELGDMNGLDTYLQAISSLATAHGERFRPTVGLRNMVAANRLGRKSGAGFYTYNEDGTRTAQPPS
jgi:3-hydroxybutyryl-CoA dehydrogenase